MLGGDGFGAIGESEGGGGVARAVDAGRGDRGVARGDLAVFRRDARLACGEQDAVELGQRTRPDAAARDEGLAGTCAAGSAASMARPVAVRCAGSRTPTRTTVVGARGADACPTYETSPPASTASCATTGTGVERTSRSSSGPPSRASRLALSTEPPISATRAPRP